MAVRPSVRIVVLVAGLLLGALPSAAAPDRKLQAEQLLKAGNAAYDRGAYEDALVKYRRAMALYPSFKLRLNLGLTLAALGELVEAATELELFLEEGRGRAAPDLAREAEQWLGRLQKRLALLTVEGEGAVSIDGTPRGAAPLRTWLLPGAHRIALEKDGRRAERIVELPAGRSYRLELRVEPGASSAPISVRPAPEARRAPAATPFYRTWWFWTLVGGVAVTGATVGGVLGARAARAGSMPAGELPDVR